MIEVREIQLHVPVCTELVQYIAEQYIGTCTCISI